jgi:hypothetical protein
LGVRFDPTLPPGKIVPVPGGVEVHCRDCADRIVEFTGRYVLVHTAPVCAFDQQTGQLVELDVVDLDKERSILVRR